MFNKNEMSCDSKVNEVNFRSNNYLNRKLLSNFLFWTTALILILIAGLRPIGLDRDSISYATFLQTTTEINFLDKEPFFWIIKWFNDTFLFGNIHTFFLIFAALSISIKFLAIKRLSKLPWLSLIVYLSLYFILHEMTQIRVGVATGFFLLSIPDIYNRNFGKFIIKASFASLFHYSAIIMIPLYFLNPKKVNIIYLLLPIVGLILACVNLSKIILENINNYLPKFLAYKISLYLFLLELREHSEINIINFYYLSLLLFLYFGFFLYFKNKIIHNYDTLYIKILSIMLFSFYFFSDVPLFAFRISEFLGTVVILLLPNYITYFKQKEIVLNLFLYG